MKEITIVVPVFNEADNIDEMTHQLTKIQSELISRGLIAYVLFVDNASTDESLNKIEFNAKNGLRVNYISWVRNMGVSDSVLNAIETWESDSYFIIDCDGQDDPKLITQFVDEMITGYDFVYGIRFSRDESKLLTFFRIVFKIVAKVFGGNGAGKVESGFWLINKNVRDDLLSNPPSTKYLAGALSIRGYKSKGIPYVRARRRAGKSKFGFRRYLAYGIEGIIGDNLRPLRITFILGAAGIFLSLLTLLSMFIAIVVLNQRLPVGQFSVGLMINLYGLMVLLAMGIIGEYVGRAFVATTRIPKAIIRKSFLARK